MAHQLRMRGAEPDFEDQNDIAPWIDWCNGILPTSVIQPCEVPRIFKCHLTWQHLIMAGIVPSSIPQIPSANEPTQGWPRIVYIWRSLGTMPHHTLLAYR
jgi:hypothetical protein